MQNCEHNFIIERGWRVCSECGLTDSEYNQISLKYNDNHKFENEKHKTRSYTYLDKHYTQQYKWKRFKRLTLMDINVSNRVYIDIRLNQILSQLNINEKIKKILHYYITLKNPKFVYNNNQPDNSLYHLIFKYIIENDLHITTMELFKILKQFNRNINLLKLTNHIKRIRKYYWYITQILNNFSLEYSTQLTAFKTIKQYYDLIRFRLNAHFNPILLINYLTYQYINEFCFFLPFRERKATSFSVKVNSLATCRQSIRKYKDKIKQYDKNFNQQLIFRIRGV